MWSLSKLPAVPAPCLPPAIDKNDVRGNTAFAFRYGTAAAQAQFARVPQTPNGEEAKYADKSATYSKGLKQKSYGIVDPEVFKAFRGALGTRASCCRRRIPKVRRRIRPIRPGMARSPAPALRC
jgi:hypothetical protein